jgi:subtilase family serine protease
MYPVGGGIPADTPTGTYYICAKVDAGNKIAESNEGNNSFCKRVYIKNEQTPRLPDLQVRFTCPNTIVAGQDIGYEIKLRVWNPGTAPAAGTDTAGNNGYMVDLMLSTDTNTPGGWAVYSANFSEDVLLKGGRISNTKTLNPGQSRIYPVGGGIPADTPSGTYYICAKVDAGNKITESNEGNNSYCKRVYIKNKSGK